MSRWCLPAVLAAVLCSGQPSLCAPAPPPRPARTVTLPPGPGDLKQVPVTVALPHVTPFPRGSAAEGRYLRGYAEGYADGVRGRLM